VAVDARHRLSFGAGRCGRHQKPEPGDSGNHKHRDARQSTLATI
jgi:hypothetical protein